MMYYVYILTNKSNKVLYTGVTNDLVRRMYEHRHHLDPESFTAKYKVRSAIQREKQIKSWSRVRKDALISEENPSWDDLYQSILG